MPVSKSKSLEPVNVTLYAKKIADVIKIKDFDIGRLSWIIWMEPKCNDKLLYKRKADMRDRKGEGNVTIEAEIVVMWPQAKEFQQPPEAWRGNKQIPP